MDIFTFKKDCRLIPVSYTHLDVYKRQCYILAYKFNMGVTGIWLGIGIDTVFRGLICIFRVKSGKWKYAYKH